MTTHLESNILKAVSVASTKHIGFSGVTPRHLLTIMESNYKSAWTPLNVILIGPYGAGKTTLAKLVSERMRWSWYSLDEVYTHYLRQMEGYNFDDLSNQINSWDFISPKRQPFNAYVIEKFFLEHSKSDDRYVLDFGAGHSIFEDHSFFSQVQKILTPYPNVILILPTYDQQESIQILKENVRKHGLKGTGLTDTELDRINNFILAHHSNYDLAKVIIYTKGKLPEETSKEICNFVLGQSSLSTI